ncbi:MAG: UDP-N-acetylmuramate dehydrogenase [Candidatus Fermentibacteraceae bacterium]
MICRAAMNAFPDRCRVVLLSDLTTWRIGGPCAVLTPRRRNELAEMMKWVEGSGTQWSMIGRGSNLLAPSRGWDGVVISLQGEFRSFETRGKTVTAGGGVPLPSLAGAACSLGLSGMVFAVGIPGTAGGAVFMNAGAYGASMMDVVRSVQVVYPGGETRHLSSEECGFGYRTSSFQTRPGAVCSVVLELLPGDRGELRERAREVLGKRRANFPITVPNAGSVFRRPKDGPPPGMLLEECGLKGFSLGGARFSPVHANFIENTGNACSEDILTLVSTAKRRVLERTGILLHEEIRVLGGET